VNDVALPASREAGAASGATGNEAPPLSGATGNEAPTLASAGVVDANAPPVATAPGLARTQGDESGGRRSPLSLALIVVAVAVAVTALVVVALLRPWATGDGAPPAATELPADSEPTATASTVAPSDVPSGAIGTATDQAASSNTPSEADASVPAPSQDPAAATTARPSVSASPGARSERP
jgi:hypothetical protein